MASGGKIAGVGDEGGRWSRGSEGAEGGADDAATRADARRAKLIALHEAARTDREEAVRKLLGELPASAVNEKVDNFTALMHAARSGSLKALSELLKHKADPNLTGEGEGTPLVMAATISHHACCEALIRAGADPNIPVPKSKETAIMRAAHLGSAMIIELLCSHGAKVNIADAQGRTPLHWSLDAARFDAMGPLLASGANPHLKDKHGVTALELAESRGAPAAIIRKMKTFERFEEAHLREAAIGLDVTEED